MVFYGDQCADEASARQKPAEAITERTKLGKHREALRDRRGELYDRIDAAEAEIVKLQDAAEHARDNFAMSGVGLATIERAPQQLASAESALDLARRQLAALGNGHALIDADEKATDDKVRDANEKIDFYSLEVLRLSPAVRSLQ